MSKTKVSVTLSEFYKSKTFWAGVVVFVGGGLKAVGVDIPIEIILMALGLEGYFIRYGMKK